MQKNTNEAEKKRKLAQKWRKNGKIRAWKFQNVGKDETADGLTVIGCFI